MNVIYYNAGFQIVALFMVVLYCGWIIGWKRRFGALSNLFWLLIHDVRDLNYFVESNRGRSLGYHNLLLLLIWAVTIMGSVVYDTFQRSEELEIELLGYNLGDWELPAIVAAVIALWYLYTRLSTTLLMRLFGEAYFVKDLNILHKMTMAPALLLALPLSLCYLFSAPQLHKFLLLTIAFIAVSGLFITFFKTFRLFNVKNISKVLCFLYLCTVEALPILFIIYFGMKI